MLPTARQTRLSVRLWCLENLLAVPALKHKPSDDGCWQPVVEVFGNRLSNGLKLTGAWKYNCALINKAQL